MKRDRSRNDDIKGHTLYFGNYKPRKDPKNKPKIKPKNDTGKLF